VGNRLTKNATSYTYDDADQMTAAGGVSYGYDANGNQTSRGSDTFAYDHENRLTQSVIGAVTSTSTYNGDGLRMSHTVSGNTTSYTWDAASRLPVVLQDGTNTYVYGLDLISATDGAGVQTYFLSDGLGSTTNLTDGSANSIDGYNYDVFGALRSQSGSSPNYWLFTGEQRDSDSSFYYLRARYYDSATGRFLGQDGLPGVVRIPSTFNRYAYVTNNPTNLVDPYGFFGIPNPLKGVADVVVDFVVDNKYDIAQIALAGSAVLSCAMLIGPICVASLAGYAAVSAAETVDAYVSRGPCQGTLALATGILGYPPFGGGGWGLALAGTSGLIEGFGCPSTVHASDGSTPGKE